ncbi:uncharacterized protein LOC121864213 [Homarus americanus]|nr:uncharacterized protein LOC121864213 [Homarus americanus]XP_042219192.1 uncharacterized protein LOC121864213 [Homarus americanus]
MDDTQELECTQVLSDNWDDEGSVSGEPCLAGWLEVYGIRHDIYEGETKIGRDAASCKIVLQHKVLSNQHAVIDVEEGLHTIADLGSRNKTRLGKMILKPNVRYALQGGETITFGNVQTKYIVKPKEVQNNDSGSETGSESMFLLDGSEDRPTSPVSTHRLSDIIPATPATTRAHTTTTGSDGNLFVSESPSTSQSTPFPDKSTRMTVSESPNNLSAIRNLDEDKDGSSFFFEPSQPPKAKPTNTPEYSNAKPGRVSFEKSEIEESISDASTDIEDDEVPPQLFGENECQNVSNTSHTTSRDKDNTKEGSEGDLPDSKVMGALNDKDSETTGDSEETKNNNSNTNIEEDIFNQPTQAFSIVEKSPKLAGNISDRSNLSPIQKYIDSTQEIMEAFELTDEKNIDDDDDDTDDETLLPTQPFIASQSPTCNKFQNVDDDVPTQLFLDSEDFVFKKPFATVPKLKNKIADSSATGKDDDIPDELLSETTNGDILDTPTQPYLYDDQHETAKCNDSILDAPTLPFDDTSRILQNKKSDEDDDDDDDDIESIFNQPTQPYSAIDNDTSCNEDAPTQYFDPVPENEISREENKSIKSEDESDIFNQPTQVYSAPNDDTDVDPNALTQPYADEPENKGVKESACAKRRSITSKQILSPVPTGEHVMADDINDDLPPTQIFTVHSPVTEAPLPAAADDNDITPTQLYVLETDKNKLFPTPTGAHDMADNINDDDDDDLPPTQIFTVDSPVAEAPLPAVMDDDMVQMKPTQVFTDDSNKKVDGPPHSTPGDTRQHSKEPLRGISQTWGKLDAEVTQDISLDSLSGIKETGSDPRESKLMLEEKDKFKDTNLNDTFSDASETLLNDKQIEDEDDEYLSDLKYKNDNNASSSSKGNLLFKSESEKYDLDQAGKKIENIMKDDESDNIVCGMKEHINKNSNEVPVVEQMKEDYNSDESTDIEDEISTRHKIVKLISNASSTPMKESVKSCPETAYNYKMTFEFKRGSRMAPVAVASTAARHSTQDSDTSVDLTYLKFSLPDSEENESQENFFETSQTPGKERKVTGPHDPQALSSSDSEDVGWNISQRLFELSPECDGVNNEKVTDGENTNKIEDNASEKAEVFRKSSDIGQKHQDQEGNTTLLKRIEKGNPKELKKLLDAGEINNEPNNSIRNETVCGSGLGNYFSPIVTPKRVKGQRPTRRIRSSLSFDNVSDDKFDAKRKTKRKTLYNDESGSDISDKFSGFDESSCERQKECTTDKVNEEKPKSESRTVQEVITKARMKDDEISSNACEGKSSEAGVTTASDDYVEDQQQMKDKIKETEPNKSDKQSLTGRQTRRKEKENKEGLLPVRVQRKSSRVMKIEVEEKNSPKHKTRIQTKESDCEPSSKQFSASRGSVAGVTIDDVQSSRRSGRKRNNSDASNLSHLSSISNQSTSRRSIPHTRSSKDHVKGGRSQAHNIDECKPVVSSVELKEDESKVRESKMEVLGNSPSVTEDNREPEKKPDSALGENSAKSGDKTKSIKKQTRRSSRNPEPLVIKSGKNKASNKEHTKEDVLNENTCSSKIIIQEDSNAELKKPDNLTEGLARTSRVRKVPKRFSPGKDVAHETSQATSTRSRGRLRKLDISEVLLESSTEILPAKTRRGSAIPKLHVSTATENCELEILPARQRSNTKLSLATDDTEKTKKSAPVSKKKCKSTSKNPQNLEEKSEATQHESTNHQSKKKQTQTARKARASIATPLLTFKEDPVIPKKLRHSIIVQQKINEDSKNIAEVKNIQTKDKKTKMSAKEKVTLEDKSKPAAADQLHISKKEILKQGQLKRGNTNDNSEEETGSSQSSDDSHVSLRSKRMRGSGYSKAPSSSSSRSSRSGRSRMGSPSQKDILLWSPSQRQQQASTKPRVLFTGYKDTLDEKIVTDLGGMVVESPRECSVLVTTNVRRTFKLLAVIGRGLPIVTPTWISTSKLAGNFVDPWKYLVKDTESENKFGFQLSQSLKSAKTVLLFEGLSIHATDSVKPAPDQMKEIVECSGGEYLDMPPKKYAPQLRIVSCLEDKHQWTSFKKMGIPILGTEFILTGLLRHELLLDDFYLE